MQINVLIPALSRTMKKGSLAKRPKNEGDMPYAANLEKLALPSVAEVVAAAKAVSYR
jgi:hypothetical protein